MDRTVQMHELPPDALSTPYRSSTTPTTGPRTASTLPRTTTYACHSGRVKVGAVRGCTACPGWWCTCRSARGWGLQPVGCAATEAGCPY